MKNRKNSFWFVLMLAIGTIGLFTQCDKDEDVEPQIIFVVDGNGNSKFNKNALREHLNGLPKEDLSAQEEAGVLFMREEEKLAHDVYAKMYELWNSQIFQNISESELTHTDAVLLLIDRYNLTDPVGISGVGVFKNETLQELYTDLTAEGAKGLIDALTVGAVIEEIDILDLKDQLSNVVDNQDIELVYDNLMRGSRNHLRAFVKHLSKEGVTYVPQYLTVAEFDEIINGDMETGG